MIPGNITLLSIIVFASILQPRKYLPPSPDFLSFPILNDLYFAANALAILANCLLNLVPCMQYMSTDTRYDQTVTGPSFALQVLKFTNLLSALWNF